MSARRIVNFCLIFALGLIVSPVRGAWLDGTVPPAEIDAVIELLLDADSHGLDPAAYGAADLARDWRDPFTRLDPYRLARLDRRLDAAVVAFAAHLTGPRWAGAAGPEDSTAALDRAVDPAAMVVGIRARGAGIAAALEDLAPSDPHYRRLCAALVDLRTIANAGGWPRVGEGPTLHPGEVDPRVPALRRRLGLAAVVGPDSLRFDADLAAAVVRFQSGQGLAADGVIGRQTIAALDVSVEARVNQVALNLERLRCLPRDLGRRHVLVNVAAGTLEMVADDTIRGSMRAVVGRPDRPTPTLSSRITNLELNPAWNIPPKLARKDVLPHLREDPEYLRNQGIRVFANWLDGAPELDPATIDWSAIEERNLAFKLRQDPGPLNPLGRVKFHFSNPYAVYIHDTPSRGRFAAPARFYSSGCVRIEDPRALARFLVEDGGPAIAEKLEAALASDRRGQFSLPRAVPVHLVYWTAWVDQLGMIHFRDDVYGHDTLLAAARQTPSSVTDASPVANRSGVDVDEVGRGVVTHAAPLFP